MARCGCGSSNGGSIANGPNTTVTGSGTPANPYMIAAHTDCAEARACFTAGNGLNINAGTGALTVVLDPNPTNSLTNSAAGLFVTPSTAAITTGPGLLGTGTGPNPARANIIAWGFPGTADAGGSNIYVDSSGRLRGEPGYRAFYAESRITLNYGPALAVPTGAGMSNVDVPFTYNLVNPDTRRSVTVVEIREFDARLTIPAGGTAASGFNGEEMYRMQNTGSSTMTGVHAYGSRMDQVGTLGPGASMLLSMQPQLGSTASGSGGSTCTQINMSHRVLMFPI